MLWSGSSKNVMNPLTINYGRKGWGIEEGKGKEKDTNNVFYSLQFVNFAHKSKDLICMYY